MFTPAVDVARRDRHEPIRLRMRQRPQQRRVDDAEDRQIDADPEREHGDDGRNARAAQPAHCVPQCPATARRAAAAPERRAALPSRLRCFRARASRGAAHRPEPRRCGPDPLRTNRYESAALRKRRLRSAGGERAQRAPSGASGTHPSYPSVSAIVALSAAPIASANRFQPAASSSSRRRPAAVKV